MFASCIVRLFFGLALVGCEQDTNKERSGSEGAPNKPGTTAQGTLHNYTGIPVQLHKGYCTTVRAYRRKYTRGIAQLHRHTGATAQGVLHNCTGIPVQLHKGYCTTAQAYRCNCTRGIAQLHRHTGATAQGVIPCYSEVQSPIRNRHFE